MERQSKTKDFSYTLNIVGSTMNNKFIDFSNSQFVGQDYYDEVSPEDPLPLPHLATYRKKAVALEVSTC